METYELLVKLASIGTAGVCVLAIFIIGTSIMRLKADTPEWKISLMNKYMNTCVIIAIICTVSGGANAYFNQNKIQTAKEEAESANERTEVAVRAFEQLEENYNIARGEILRYKEDVNNQILQLEERLEMQDISPQTMQGINAIKQRTIEFNMKPTEELMKGIDRDRIGRIR